MYLSLSSFDSDSSRCAKGYDTEERDIPHISMRQISEIRPQRIGDTPPPPLIVSGSSLGRPARWCKLRHIIPSAFKIRTAHERSGWAIICEVKILNQVSNVRMINVSRRPRNIANHHNCKIICALRGGPGKKFESKCAQMVIKL